jgi:hypothetical protein
MNYQRTYVCESCFHIQKRYRRSKCEECKGITFVCDEWIAPIIQILNKKGYKTKYCCSGHLTSHACVGKKRSGDNVAMNFYHCFGCYVFFDIPRKEMSEMELPEGFEIDMPTEGDAHPQTIRSVGQAQLGDYSDAIGHLHKSMLNLHEWAFNLPSRTALVVD